jgi:hypothetical protein
MHVRGLKFSVAGPSDDAIIRQLLRSIPMNRQIGLSLQREPSYFAGELIGKSRSTTFILTDEARSRAYALASLSEMKIDVDGRAAEVGYLSNLRSDPSVRGGRYLLDGFRFLRTLCEADPLPYYITTIFDDNTAAKSILEKGCRGMPRYVPIGKLVSYLIPLTRKSEKFSSGVTTTKIVHIPQVQVPGRHYRLNGCEVGLTVADYSAYKQIVVTSYSKKMSLVRRPYNLYSRLRSLPLLPHVGGEVRLLYATNVNLGTNPAQANELLGHAVSDVSCHRFDYLVVGLMADHPLSLVVEKMATRKEYSTVYQVLWGDESRLPMSNLHLEVASL